MFDVPAFISAACALLKMYAVTLPSRDEDEALESGLKEKAKQFAEKGAEV